MGKRIYDLGGILNAEERAQLKPSGTVKIGAVPAGEFRCPKKGEWYLSGAIPQAYKAFGDMSTKYHIAKLVGYREKICYEIVE